VQIKKFDSINVVPFIDIMLILLVIVLTTATFVSQGIIPVNLSESKSSSKITKHKSLTITIKENGDIFFNNKNIIHNKVVLELENFQTNTDISINCDKNTKFKHFVYIIDILKLKGYTNLGIITKYE